MKPTKVMTVMGTRPEIIRLSRIMAALDAGLDHVTVHTGQNYDYELNKIFFEDLELRTPDHFLNAAGGNAAATIGRIIERIDVVLEREAPDALLVLGDTNSCLAVLPAKRRKIPIFHMEAGNRCFDQRVPEEINRRIVDHVADINLCYSAISREYLLREGFTPDQIIKVGSPMLEVINHYRPKIERSQILPTLGLQSQRYFVVSCHREENVDSDTNLLDFVDSMQALARAYGEPIIMSTHPRTRTRIEEKKIRMDPLVRMLKPLGYSDYVRLQLEARLVLSDSGTITEESSLLNFPALNIRQAHERPEGMEEAAVIMTGLKAQNILEAARIAIAQPRGDERRLAVVNDYDVSNVSEKVLRIILSYVPFVRSRVWKQ